MKKYIFFVAVAVSVVLNGCSEDDAGPKHQIKKLSISSFSNGVAYSTKNYSFSYSGSRLSRISDGQKETTFSYDNEQLSVMKSTVNNAVFSTTEFAYSNDRLSERITEEAGQIWRVRYFYNVNNSLIESESARLINGNFQVRKTLEYNYVNQNVYEKSIWQTDEGSTFSSLERYTYYDDKTNPLENMNPHLKIFFEELNFGIEGLSLHNRIKSQVFVPSTSTNPIEYRFAVTYDGDGYPRTIEKRTEAGDVLVQRITITYN